MKARLIIAGLRAGVMSGLWVAAVASGAEPFGGEPIELGPGVTARNIAEPFDYFANSWTVIGLKDHPFGTRISPSGDFVLGDDLIVRPLVGSPLRPLNNRIRKTLRHGHLPIVTSSFVVNDVVRYTIEAVACPMDPGRDADFEYPTSDNFLSFVRVSMTNISPGPADAAFGLHWRPKTGDFPCVLEGTAVADVRAIVAGRRLFGVVRSAEAVAVSATGSLVRFRAPLAPQAEAVVSFVLPFHPVPVAEAGALAAMMRADFAAAAVAAESYWQRLLDRGATIEVPEEKVAQTYRASLVYQFIGRDRSEVHGGEGFYDEQYIRDGTYQATSLAHAGFLDEARGSMERLLRFQLADGRFESQKGQLDANGYAMWGPVELFRLTGDIAWLRSVYPAIRKAARWVEQTRRQEKDPASPFFGILPNAVADGEFLWDGRHHIVGYDWQNLRGMQAVAYAARVLEKAEEADALEKEIDDYRRCILKAIERTGLPYIPPSYEKAGTHWGNLEAIFPTPLIDPLDPRLTATLRFVRTDFGRATGNPGGFIEGVIQWNPPGSGAIHPYMSQFVTQSHLVRGERDETLDGFYSFLLHTTSTHGFPEGVFWRRREAWSNTVPHLWAAALYVTTLRNMIFREQADALHLLSCVPDHWLTTAPGVRVKAAPTHFGRLNMSAVVADDLLQVTIGPADRAPPKFVVVHAPVGMAFDGADAAGDASAAHLEPAMARLDPEIARRGGTVRLRVKRPPGPPTLTFASRVAAYLNEAGPALRPIPGVVATPSPEELGDDRCVPLDLSRAATTNSLTAPFKVPNPGELVFAGLSPGDLTVCGVPMRILDPARNDDKNLVVLHGAGACEILPREVEVPVGKAGRYICVLGNVTGWAPDDPGTGPWGAVAEYEIRYADGRVQTVPLITGRTADEWTGPASAVDVEVALRGRPWHLNLLTVALQPGLVRSVVFRDRGTPASPVVAAMTLIR